jgi:hypothetical protein
MGLVICSCCVLSLFYLRDVFILGAKQEHVPAKIFLYAVLMSLYLPGAIGIAYSLPGQRALDLLGSPWVWTAVLALHVGLWRFAAWVKHGPHCKDRMWLTVIAPAPMFLLSAVVVSHRFLNVVEGSRASTFGLIVFTVWTASVLAGVLAFRFIYRGWEDWDCVADVAAFTSWTGLGILPFTGVVEWLQVFVKYD